LLAAGAVCAADVEVRLDGPDDFAAVRVESEDYLASTATRVYFSPEDDCDQVVMACLRGARESVDAAVFLVSHPGIADALVRAHKRGVRVRVLMDGRQADFAACLDEDLQEAGVAVRRTRGTGSMHNKFALVDDRLVLTGSYNWTVGGAAFNDENLLLMTDGLDRFRRKFDDLWSRAGP
jgi:phosphatidylserine/phosphatidylglycerophosphate/cardiolipin synthase-like enzyme